MPIKTRCTPVEFSPPSASRVIRKAHKKYWDESCGRSPVEQDSSVAVSASVSESPGVWYSNFEEIVYTNSNFLIFNPCHHIKVKRHLYNGGTFKAHFHRETGGDLPFVGCAPYQPIHESRLTECDLSIDFGSSSWASVVGSSPEPLDDYLPDDPALLNNKLAELDSIALDHFIPQLDDGRFSASVFIVELLELKFLCEGVASIATSLPRHVRRLMRKPLAELSDHWLSAVFGWIPLVNDAKTIVHKFKTVGDQVYSFFEQSNKRQTLHFQKALSPLTFRDSSWFEPSAFDLKIEDTGSGSSPYNELNPVFDDCIIQGLVSREVPEVTYHATIDFEYRVPSNEGIEQLLAELDVWGINLSISDVWEVIPFSFVVDWIINVGGWLRQFDKTNIPIQVIIYDYCRSIKYRYNRRFSGVGTSPSFTINVGDPDVDNYPENWVLNPTEARAGIETSAYHRWVGKPHPTDEQLPDLRFPSGMQWITASALLATRKGR